MLLHRLIDNTKDHVPISLVGFFSTEQDVVSCPRSPTSSAHGSSSLCQFASLCGARSLGEDHCVCPCTITFLEDKSQALHFADVTAISSEIFKLHNFTCLLQNEFNDNSSYLSSSCQTFLLQSIYPSPGISGSLTCSKGGHKVVSCLSAAFSGFPLSL